MTQTTEFIHWNHRAYAYEDCTCGRTPDPDCPRTRGK